MILAGDYSRSNRDVKFWYIRIGTHIIHTFFINAGGYTDSSGYPLDDVADIF